MNRTLSLLSSAMADPTRTAEDGRATRVLRMVGEGMAPLRRWRDADRRRRAEIRTWKQARAFEELAVLTARWLRGHLSWHPNGHRGGPDSETVPLVEALAAANEAGFLTDGSQPGELATFHELPWRQRAFVSGFVADPALARALCARAAEAGLVVRAYRPGSRVDENGERNAVDVTTWGARVNTGMGNWVPPRAVRRILPGCDRRAVREVARAWQVTLIDPVWGRNTVLWPALGEVLGSRHTDAPSRRPNRPASRRATEPQTTTNG
ncbi:hypothetical protein [Streptomyces sp. NPDC006335]|uniref:DUF6919 domain-containing protein n=1 Tax=Streptomyces sp. NPDC006335 TaxID=3156895 RepID=UPI0033AB0F88